MGLIGIQVRYLNIQDSYYGSLKLASHDEKGIDKTSGQRQELGTMA